MSVVSVNETYHSRESERDQGDVKAVREFVVTTDAITDGSETARFATGIPRQGDSHPDNAYLTCRGPRVSPRDGSPLAWTVVCEYVSRGRSEPIEDSPLLRPVVFEWGTETASEPILYQVDDDGIPTTYLIQNSAGDPFDPPVEREITNPTLTATRNERTFDGYSVKSRYENRLNLSTFYGAGPFQVRCASINAREEWQGRTHYWVVTYSFIFHPNTWGVAMVDRGTRILDENGQKVDWRDRGGNPGPTNLDGAGVHLSDLIPYVYYVPTAFRTDPPNHDQPDPSRYREDFYQIYGAAEFNNLRLGSVPYP